MSLFFDFAQFEFTHAIGPGTGRYVVQPAGSGDDHDEAFEAGDVDDLLLFHEDGTRNVTGATRTTGVADVLVITVVEAEPARFGWGRSKKVKEMIQGADPGAVPLLLATYVLGTAPIEGARDAGERFEHLSVDFEEQKRRIDEGLRVVNRAIRAYRVASGDPYLLEIGRRHARSVRLGYGSTTEVAEGQWSRAFAVPQPNVERTKRSDRLRPSETTARLMSGRAAVLESEDLLLRTMLDLDHGRTRAAAMQAYSALQLLRYELPAPSYSDVEERSTAALADRAREIAEISANGPLDDHHVAEIEGLLDSAEAHINRWRYPVR